MDKVVVHGTWESRGFVFYIPAALRAKIRTIEVTNAWSKVLGVNPSAFYLIMPKDAFKPEKWLVSIDAERGVLWVDPPLELVELEGPMELPTIGFVLSRVIPIND